MFFEFFKSEFEWKKTFIVATTVIALGSTMASGRETGQPKNLSRQILLESSSSPVMEYVELCRSGNDCKRFSRLVMGTDHLAQGQWTSDSQPEPDSTHVFNVLDEAARWGINFFDTSPIYVGGIENKLGQWRKSQSQIIKNEQFYYPSQGTPNPDRQLYVLTKGGFPFDLYYNQSLPAGNHSMEFTRLLKDQGLLSTEITFPLLNSIPLTQVPPGTYASWLFGAPQEIVRRVREELGRSLSNLEDVTIYLMHRDDGDAFKFAAIERQQTPVDTIMNSLSDPELSSHYWMLGWSNWQESRVNESLYLNATHPQLPRPVINSPYFSLFEMNGQRSIHALGVQVTHDQMMNPEFEKGIKIMPYSPLGGFSILDQPEPQWENARKAAKKKYEDADPYWRNVYPSIFTAQNEARWVRLKDFTKKYNISHHSQYTLDQMMNAYVLAHPRTDFLAIGALTKEQLRRTVQSLQLAKTLTTQDLNYLYDGSKSPL